MSDLKKNVLPKKIGHHAVPFLVLKKHSPINLHILEDGQVINIINSSHYENRHNKT